MTGNFVQCAYAPHSNSSQVLDHDVLCVLLCMCHSSLQSMQVGAALNTHYWQVHFQIIVPRRTKVYIRSLLLLSFGLAIFLCALLAFACCSRLIRLHGTNSCQLCHGGLPLSTE